MNIVVSNCPDDGVTDATASLQGFINSAQAGDTLILQPPAVAYKIMAPLTITKPITIVGKRSVINQATPNTGGIQVTSSSVTLQGLILNGTQYIVPSNNERGISLTGSLSNIPLTDVEVMDCTVSNWGMYGIFMQYVTGFRIRDCNVSNAYYGGICGLSVISGMIIRNTVNNVVGPSGTTYGIIVTRNANASSELVSDPHSTDIVIAGNYVVGVTHWEGIDTHAGRRIQILGNRVYGCYKGVEATYCPNAAGVIVYAPKYCVIDGNIIDSGVTDGSCDSGISVAGAGGSSVGVVVDYAEGIVVSNNVVRGHGVQTTPLGSGVYCVNTRGLKLHGNNIVECSPNGILLYHDNLGFSCDDTVQDPWSVSQQTRCICAESDWNRGVIGGNAYVRGSKSAAHVLEIGLNVGDYPNNSISLNKNYSDVTTGFTLYDPGHHTV
jgi:hypothetical protein